MRYHIFAELDQIFVVVAYQCILFLSALAINYVAFIIFSIIYQSFKSTSTVKKILLIAKPLLISFLLPIVFGTAFISHFFIGDIFPKYYAGQGLFYQVPMPNGHHVYFSYSGLHDMEDVLGRLRNKHGEDLDFLFNKVVKDNTLLYLICRDDNEVLRINLENSEKKLFGKDVLNKIGKEPIHISKLHENYWHEHYTVDLLLGSIHLLILFGAIVLGILLIRRITKKEATTNRKQTTEST